jgi:hypothetical protein
MKQFETKKSSKSSEKFYCANCDYSTCRSSQYARHLITTKHLNNQNETNLKQNSSFSSKILKCDCNLVFNSRTSLWRHKKKCNIEEYNIEIPQQNEINLLDKETILSILKQNSEFQQMLLEQNKTILELSKNYSITNSNNNTTNSHNKSFNLQFFLNETCKNAMNITDFVNSLQLQLSDLEKVGELGYVEGISNIIIKNLNALDVTERPVHCTDKKRETMYVKDENKWEKEDDNNTKLHKMVRKVSNKNIDLISEFKEVHPEWKKSTSKVSDQFDKIIIESMGGKGDNDYEKEEKIIKKVAKAVFVDKVL